MKNVFLLAFIFNLSIVSFVNAQSKQTQHEIFASTYHNSKILVKSQSYVYQGEMVFENRTREKLNEASSQLTIDKTKMSGEMTSIKSENKTIDVSGEISNYDVVFNDEKQKISINFNVTTAKEKLTVTIEVTPNGNAFLTTSSNNGTTINWTGKLK